MKDEMVAQIQVKFLHVSELFHTEKRIVVSLFQDILCCYLDYEREGPWMKQVEPLEALI